MKNYFILHYDFRINEYLLYTYEKERKFTTRQAWLYIRAIAETAVSFGPCKNIGETQAICVANNIDINKTIVLMTFQCS